MIFNDRYRSSTWKKNSDKIDFLVAQVRSSWFKPVEIRGYPRIQSKSLVIIQSFGHLQHLRGIFFGHDEFDQSVAFQGQRSGDLSPREPQGSDEATHLITGSDGSKTKQLVVGLGAQNKILRTNGLTRFGREMKTGSFGIWKTGPIFSASSTSAEGISPVLVFLWSHSALFWPRVVLANILRRDRRHMGVVDGDGAARPGSGDPFVQVLEKWPRPGKTPRCWGCEVQVNLTWYGKKYGISYS